MKYKQYIVINFYCICLCLLGLFWAVSVYAKEISILTENKLVSYSVEVADTPVLQQKGLMYRKNMPQNKGMLFDFNVPKTVSMWMKNTYIPLDILFVDKDGVIRHIYENAHPLDETPITCPLPVKYVIELNAGQVKENQIKIGNNVKDL